MVLAHPESDLAAAEVDPLCDGAGLEIGDADVSAVWAQGDRLLPSRKHGCDVRMPRVSPEGRRDFGDPVKSETGRVARAGKWARLLV